MDLRLVKTAVERDSWAGETRDRAIGSDGDLLLLEGGGGSCRILLLVVVVSSFLSGEGEDLERHT